jgi:hypothetical protein
MELKVIFLLCKTKHENFTCKSIEEQLNIINKEFKINLSINDYEIFLYNEIKSFKSHEDFELESRKQLNNFTENVDFYDEKRDYSIRCGQMFVKQS